MGSSVVLALHLSAAAMASAQPTAAPAAAEDPRAIEARQACLAGDVARGIAVLEAYLAATGDSTAVYNMGRCYQQNGRRSEAEARFREYLRRTPNLTAHDRADVEKHLKALETPAPVVVVAPPAPAPRRDSRVLLRRIGIGAAAVGLVAAGVGTWFGLEVKSRNQAMEEELAKGQPSALRYASLMNEAARAEKQQWVSLAVGGAALATGAVCSWLGFAQGEHGSVDAIAWIDGDGVGARLGMRF